MADPVLIANASAFWGDRPDAAARLVAARPELDFITFDYLAELSLSIMAAQRARDPSAGYARDFIEVLPSLVPYYRAGGRARMVSNAGGLDPAACAAAVRDYLASAGLSRLRIAVVTGDDVLEFLRTAPPDGPEFAHLETRRPIGNVAARLVAANAYLGAEAVATALRGGADIVITGRIADPSLTVGPCLAHFDWDSSDYDAIAGATVAGHLIECGTQVTGGFSTDWMSVPRPESMGFPIAEVHDDGACVIRKPPGSGGAVTIETVKEQLLYEVLDPGNYLSPDVTASLLTLRLAEAGPDAIRVSNATGKPPPAKYKVSAAYSDGFKAHVLLTLFGHDAVSRARAAGDALLASLSGGGRKFRETLVECLGDGACHPIGTGRGRECLETVLRLSVSAAEREPVDFFGRAVASLVTAGPQGVTGYSAGRPKTLPIFAYWPCLVDRARVSPRVTLLN